MRLWKSVFLFCYVMLHYIVEIRTVYIVRISNKGKERERKWQINCQRLPNVLGLVETIVHDMQYNYQCFAFCLFFFPLVY